MKSDPNTYPFSTSKGFFGIGIETVIYARNIGTLWCSAQIMGADIIFVIGKSYMRMKTDAIAAHRQIPLLHFMCMDSFFISLPLQSKVVGVELETKSIPITEFKHPYRAVTCWAPKARA